MSVGRSSVALLNRTFYPSLCDERFLQATSDREKARSAAADAGLTASSVSQPPGAVEHSSATDECQSTVFASPHSDSRSLLCWELLCDRTHLRCAPLSEGHTQDRSEPTHPLPELIDEYGLTECYPNRPATAVQEWLPVRLDMVSDSGAIRGLAVWWSDGSPQPRLAVARVSRSRWPNGERVSDPWTGSANRRRPRERHPQSSFGSKRSESLCLGLLEQ